MVSIRNINGEVISDGETLQQAIDASKSFFGRPKLYMVDLREVDLRRANLRRAVLRNANLRRANLCEANLLGQNFAGRTLAVRKSNARIFEG